MILYFASIKPYKGTFSARIYFYIYSLCERGLEKSTPDKIQRRQTSETRQILINRVTLSPPERAGLV